ncbi:AAA domain-containing protein [Sporosarcina highlanderae]|uniref:AAA domain-containing protein n=1 Tax=Sporosarcina highlanderae TaxID=3035916 RepID=A0ABT8JTH9_9BACL|nr:AAA domain-containing protein [Sporosarcina highlanderae]MDN4608197.1 AAA domain-containing protein [Sporosarcina highlanderae]
MSGIPLSQKVSSLIQYISELMQLKQKPVYSYSNYARVLWVGEFPNGAECIDAFRTDMDDWLYVKKPLFPTIPKVPESLKEWVVIERTKIHVYESIFIENDLVDEDETEKKEIYLKDLPDIQNEIQLLKDEVCTPYFKEYERVNKIQSLYDQLYKTYQDLQNNSEFLEFVVSVGLLRWKQDNKNAIERHLLTSEVELHFNKEAGEMIIAPTSKGHLFDFEEDMLLVEDRLSGDELKEVRSLLDGFYEEGSIKEKFSLILTNIVNTLDSRGIYDNSFQNSKRTNDGPIVSLAPAFVLRKKSQKSIQHACEKAVEQLKKMDDSAVPENMANMFNVVDNEAEDNAFHEVEEFYFPLPSNDEQDRIISNLNHKSSVLVQGPPGTGKTHTIANVTSHLLATGQRILITSQTAKALSVLKSKLPKDLQDLSVSLLGGDASSMKDLEKVVSSISVNKERFNLSEMALSVETMESALKELKKSLNITKTELMEVREAETYVHSFPPFNGTAQQIAQQLNMNAKQFDWYTTPSSTETEFLKKEKNLVNRYIELMGLDMEVPLEYKEYKYPSLEMLDIKSTIDVIKEEYDLNEKYAALHQEEDVELQKMLEGLSDDDLSNLSVELNRFGDLCRPLLFNTYPKLRKVVTDIFENRGHLWHKVLEDLKEHIHVIHETKSEFDRSLISVDDVSIASLKKMSEDLVGHITNGGKMGTFIFRPKIVKQYKETLRKVKYNNLPVKSESQVKTIYAYARAEHAFECIEKMIIPHLLDEKPFVEELIIEEYESTLSQLELAIHIQEWRNGILSQFEFLTADKFNESLTHSLLSNIELLTIKRSSEKKSDDLFTAVKLVESLMSEGIHSLYPKLNEAIIERDIDKISSNWEQYEFYQKVMKRDREVSVITKEIKKHSPTLLNVLQSSFSDSVWAERSAIWEKAQDWKKTKDWLWDFMQKDEAALSVKYHEIEMEIRKTITDIGTQKAWISMLRKMTDIQAKHLKAWALSVKNIGKGTGKNAPRYIAEAQMHMEKCKDAIPAWIMPLNRVFENFEIRPGLFDIVIVDEASQSWHDALLLKYLAKKMIIVGDKEQISPSIVGVNADDIVKLKNKHLKSINFEFAGMLDANNSFFDVAHVMFKDTITLREHFRCMPEIIGFSNMISYSNKPLIPLRQYPANRLEPIISRYLPHGVRVGSSQNAYNEVEADEIVKEIRNCISEKKYDGKSIGVISLLGNNQAKLIQNKLIAELGAEVMEERQIICGDAYAFQGDERDVIFLSMIAAKGETRVTALTTDSARQRFNVAVSRAKDQLWVMHSLSVNDISNQECLRYQLLNYIANPLKEETEANRKKCESKFEESVFDALVAKGYRVIPQYEVAGFRIDLVVQGEQSRLAVECDGDHWHTSVDDRERDFQRERLLQRAGWTFWRVLGSVYYDNPEKALNTLWATLDEMNIRPYSEWASLSNPIIEGETDEEHMEIESKVDIPKEEDSLLKVKQSNQSINTRDILLQRQPTMTKVGKLANKAPLLKKTHEQSSLLLLDDEKNEITHIQQDLFGNSEVMVYKEKLERSGFETFIHPERPDRIYIIGKIQLVTELSRIAPKNNSFTFLSKGNKDTQGESAWYIDINFENNISHLSRDNSKVKN